MYVSPEIPAPLHVTDTRLEFAVDTLRRGDFKSTKTMTMCWTLQF